jgi:hypothetical protein
VHQIDLWNALRGSDHGEPFRRPSSPVDRSVSTGARTDPKPKEPSRPSNYVTLFHGKQQLLHRAAPVQGLL